MVIEAIKDTMWMNLHNLIHGNMAIHFCIDETKREVKQANERVEAKTFNASGTTKGFIDALVFYRKHKHIMDD